jgi:hypothetical protein
MSLRDWVRINSQLPLLVMGDGLVRLTVLAHHYSSRWVPLGYGQGNMDQTPHKCKIVNPNGGQKPKVPSLPPGPGVQGPKQLIAFFPSRGQQRCGLAGKQTPNLLHRHGFHKWYAQPNKQKFIYVTDKLVVPQGAQTDIF